MQQSPWSLGRTILVVGVGITVLIYAFLGTSSNLRCSRDVTGARHCTLTRYFLFENDPFSGLFDGLVLNWDNPATGEHTYRITLTSRDGQGTMPALGASSWWEFLKTQISSFLQYPWQYIWRVVVYNRNTLITTATLVSVLWAFLLYGTLRGHNLR